MSCWVGRGRVLDQRSDGRKGRELLVVSCGYDSLEKFLFCGRSNKPPKTSGTL